MLKEYKKQKEKLLKQYSQILKYKNLLPINEYTKEVISQKQQNLQNEHFFVSFTGQIKAGKSTLINALLFGKEIIPADDTPHTAKITIIKYGKIPKMEITFYSDNEWRELKSDKEIFEKYLKSDVEKAINNGIYPQEVINSIPLIKEESDLSKLNQYVAKEGKYTPFVNLVTLYDNNEILKEITFVDTPGTNDPNKLRDRVAKEWIGKTNANIYISYAGQAMSSVDISFIDEFLIGVPKEQKLTVINKIDSVNGIDGLNSYIAELKADENLKRREIFGDKDSLVLVSGLGALIDKMDKAGLDLNENLEYYADMLDEKGYLEAKNHNLPLLEKAIENKLIKTKGDNLISAHQKTIETIFRKKIEGLEQEIVIIRDKLGDLQKNRKELEEELEIIKKVQKSFSLATDKFREEIEIKKKVEFETFEGSISKFTNKSKDEIESKLIKIKKLKSYKNEVKWIVKEAIDKNYNFLQVEVKKMRDNLTKYSEKEIKNLEYNLRDENRNFNFSITSHIFTFFANDLSDNMKKISDKSLKSAKIDKIVSDKKGLFWTTNEEKSDIYSSIKNKINEYLEKALEDVKAELNDSIDKHIKGKIIENIEKDTNKALEKKREHINNILKDMNSNKEEIKINSKKKDRLEENLQEIKQYESEVI